MDSTATGGIRTAEEAARRRQRARWDSGETVLVFLGHGPSGSPWVELPVEHVTHLPSDVAVLAEDRVAGVLTLEVTLLDWLDPAARGRGLAFTQQVRDVLDRTPGFLLPPVLLLARCGDPLVFAHRTGAAPSRDARPLLVCARSLAGRRRSRRGSGPGTAGQDRAGSP